MKKSIDEYQVITSVGTNVLSGYLGLTVTPQPLRDTGTIVENNEVSVIIQLMGQIEGNVICAMDLATAKGIIGRMFGGMEIEQMDEMGWSAIQEFGNWFVSGVATEIANHGLEVNITHPIVNEGKSWIRSGDYYKVIPLECDCGVIEIYLTLEWK